MSSYLLIFTRGTSCVVGVYQTKTEAADAMYRLLEGCKDFNKWCPGFIKKYNKDYDPIKTKSDFKKMLFDDDFCEFMTDEEDVTYELIEIEKGEDFDWNDFFSWDSDPDFILNFAYAERALQKKTPFEVDFEDIRHHMNFETIQKEYVENINNTVVYGICL